MRVPDQYEGAHDQRAHQSDLQQRQQVLCARAETDAAVIQCQQHQDNRAGQCERDVAIGSV